MIVEIRYAGFINKGAQLMLMCVLQKLREAYPDVVITMAPTPAGGDQPFRKIVEAGMYPKAWLWSRGFQVGDLAGLLPPTFRQRYGIVLDREVDVVLDAAGFAYSDVWGEGALREFSRSARRWKKNGTLLIVLPQALGPFSSPVMRGYFKDVVEASDLVFPREKISYQHVIDVVGDIPKVQQAPDFTNLIQGHLPPKYDRMKHRFCVVPNYRMIDKTGGEDSSAYIAFMRRCLDLLRKRGAAPFLLVHEGAQDLALSRELVAGKDELDILIEDDPLAIKGILGACDATLGSRYHGLVSALSQGVPAVATGWSFKYQELFDEYGFSEGMLPLSLEENELNECFEVLLHPERRKELADQLKLRAQYLKGESSAMWEQVLCKIESYRGRQ